MKFKKIYLVLAAGFVVRLLLSGFGTLELDQNTYIAWANNLFRFGFSNFYNGWSDYLPGYLYILWVLGKINSFGVINQTLLFKLPAICADILGGFLIFKIVAKLKNKKTALWAAIFYIFSPALISNSTLWGQTDSLVGLFSLLTIYYLTRNYVLSALVLSYGTLIKPQTAFLVPVVLFIMYKKKWSFERVLYYGLIGGGLFLAAFWPFYSGGENYLSFIFSRLRLSLGQYEYSSINAFNFWGIFGMWESEDGIISKNIIGYFLGGVHVLGFYIYSLKRGLTKKRGFSYLFSSVMFLATFLFFTRMHERHLLPLFAPLIISSAVWPSLFNLYLFLSGVYLLNLSYSYVWITENFREIFKPNMVSFISTFSVFSFYYLAFFVDLRHYFKPSYYSKSLEFEKVGLNKGKMMVFLGLILVFALSTRLYRLSKPSWEYFDEVYHAFTAREMLSGNKKAWEWWNAPPAGFAYEWTHPPLAKEAMVLSMSIFSENSFYWRLPAAILGVLNVYLVYLIAKRLFDDELTGILAAGVYGLDGLALVMSRIGMNDTYLLFFVLLSFYLYLSQKHLFSAMTLGLAAASKWSVLWFLPILFMAHVLLRRKIRASYICYFIIPPIIYLGSYLPFFASGHDWQQFVELQKQMWWYHTGLTATHAYTSPWWSWPFNLRPIWLFTDSVGSKVSNIYAMGNPIVFWFGLTSIILGAQSALADRNSRLLLVVISYFAFFVSWAISPRIMFLYHYLPSVPFMAIASGLFLRRYRSLVLPFFALAILGFIYFYPHWTGIYIPQEFDQTYYWFRSWK